MLGNGSQEMASDYTRDSCNATGNVLAPCSQETWWYRKDCIAIFMLIMSWVSTMCWPYSTRAQFEFSHILPPPLAPPAQASQYQAFCSQFLGTRSSSMASSSSISFLPVMVSTWSTGMHMGVRK